MSSSGNSSSGIGFFGLLFLVLLVLKLTGFIDWSWWWITAPLWAGWLVYFLFVVIIVAVVEFFKSWTKRW